MYPPAIAGKPLLQGGQTAQKGRKNSIPSWDRFPKLEKSAFIGTFLHFLSALKF